MTISGDDRLNTADVDERKRPIYATDAVDATDYSTLPSDGDPIKIKKDEGDDFQSAASGITVPISKSLGI